MAWQDLFIKPEQKSAEKKVEKSTSTATVPTSVSSIGLPKVNQFNSGTSPVSTADKNEFSDYLNKVFTERNFPGPDYQEFSNALKMIENAPMDEKTKYTTIFAGFSVQGVTKQKLIDTANQYIKMVADQVIGFEAEISKILNTEIAAKKKQADQLKSENDEIENQMRLLTEKKNKNNELLMKTNSEINEEVSDLNIKKASFELSAKEFTDYIASDIGKIQLYLA